MTRKHSADADVPVQVPEAPERADGKIQVWNPDTGGISWVTPPEAAAGMVAHARREYGEGTPGFAAAMMQIVAFLAEHGYTPAGKPLGGGA